MRTKRVKFTAADMENNLFTLATSVMRKNIEPKRVHASVSAYKAILQLQALKLRAVKELNTKNRAKATTNLLLTK